MSIVKLIVDMSNEITNVVKDGVATSSARKSGGYQEKGHDHRK
jgi:hypothetical protein